MFLRQLCRLKNTLSRVLRGLAPTKRGVLRLAACDKREFFKCETKVSHLIQHVPLGQKVEQ